MNGYSEMSGGGYGGRERIVYDGKRMRKPIVRKSVDPSSTLINYIINRKYTRDFRDSISLNPHSTYKRFMLPPAGYIDNPVTSMCSKFCRTSINKQRCPVNCLSWTREGRRLITGNSTGEFTLWNGMAFNFETILQAHDHAVRAMTWSHNDNWMVTADHGGVIKYWQSSMTNVQLFQGHREAVRSLSFSPTDFKFVSCSDDATVKIWDFESGREERTLTGHGWDVKCVAYHTHKSLLASGSKDNLVKIWDPKSGTSLNTLHGHKNTVMKVSWNDNGNWLLTASRDQLIKLYDIRTFKEFSTLKGHTREVTSVAWHPQHERLFVSGSYDGALMYWLVGKETPEVSVQGAHENAIWDIQWHPVGHVVATASNDHTTKFWCRNRPGDPMDDKYNGGDKVSELDASDMYGTSMEEGMEEDFLPGMSDVPNADSMNTKAVNLDSFASMKVAALAAERSQANGNNRRPPPDSYTCNRCNTKGHWIEDCPLKDAQASGKKEPPEGYICKRCNVPGHFISDCPEAKIPPSNYTCHRCGEKGHWKQDCTNPPKESRTNPPTNQNKPQTNANVNAPSVLGLPPPSASKVQTIGSVPTKPSASPPPLLPVGSQPRGVKRPHPSNATDNLPDQYSMLNSRRPSPPPHQSYQQQYSQPMVQTQEPLLSLPPQGGNPQRISPRYPPPEQDEFGRTRSNYPPSRSPSPVNNNFGRVDNRTMPSTTHQPNHYGDNPMMDRNRRNDPILSLPPPVQNQRHGDPRDPRRARNRFH